MLWKRNFQKETVVFDVISVLQLLMEISTLIIPGNLILHAFSIYQWLKGLLGWKCCLHDVIFLILQKDFICKLYEYFPIFITSLESSKSNCLHVYRSVIPCCLCLVGPLGRAYSSVYSYFCMLIVFYVYIWHINKIFIFLYRNLLLGCVCLP